MSQRVNHTERLRRLGQSLADKERVRLEKRRDAKLKAKGRLEISHAVFKTVAGMHKEQSCGN
jgi:hypothetical protein